MNQPIQCTEEDLQELKRLALAVRAVSDDDDALGVALDEYDEHANPDQVLCLFEAIDRVTAERDALQLLLNAKDERVDVLESALKFYADRDHYSVDDGLNWDSCSGEPASILWHESEPWFVEDGSIARSVLAESADPMAPKCTYCGDTGQVMTGRSGDATDGNAPTMEPCGDCIPDFTPGNGNKARRRADSLGLKIPPAPSAYDGFDNGTD